MSHRITRMKLFATMDKAKPTQIRKCKKLKPCDAMFINV